MATTYPYGYGTTRYSMVQYEKLTTVKYLHPEMWRRFRRLMELAAAAGVDLGVGTGWRIQPDPPPAGFAPPGNSHHESMPSPPEPRTATAVAIDTVPAKSWDWMESNLYKVGLRSFRKPSGWGYGGTNEPWHVQPVEIPAARSKRKVPYVLPVFPLPGDPPPDLGDFLMALTAEQQQQLYDRVMGSLPGPYSTGERPPTAGPRRFVLDDQDGGFLAALLERLAAKLEA